jgi:predicted DNA-binding protein (UPF0251 family)
MAENGQDHPLTQEQLDAFRLAYELAREVVDEQNILDVSKYTLRKHDDPFGSQCYKIDFETDLGLVFEVGTAWGDIEIRFSLMYIAHDFITLVSHILSDELAPKVLNKSVMYEIKKRNLTMLELFDMNADDVDTEIREATKRGLLMVLINLPQFAKSAVEDTVGHTKLGYAHYVLKPTLADHWRELGLPADFNIMTEAELDSMRKHNIDRKRWFLGDRKQLLNINTLAKEADSLKAQYRSAKSRYVDCEKSFFTLKPNATADEWDARWTEIWTEEFPTLRKCAIDEIKHLAPYQLANMQLGEIYDYDEEVIRKKVTQSRKLLAKSAAAGGNN